MDEQALLESRVDSIETAPRAEVAEAARPLPWQIPLPIMLQASGLYEARFPLIRPLPVPIIPLPESFPVKPKPVPPFAEPGAMDGSGDAEAALEAPDVEAAIFPALLREDLRIDVDGRYPLMTASGTQYFRMTERLHWIARLRRIAPDAFAGGIWYKDGAVAAFPYTNVRIDVTRSFFPNQRRARVTFTGGGAPARVVVLSYVSAHYRDVQLEYDCAAGTTATLSIDTHAHPNRPASLPAQILSIDEVFRRAGFRVQRTGGDNIVPIPLSGADNRWSDNEMHDAMQAYWSRFANRADWSLWSLFASLHEMGSSLGGIMFDDIGPNHRQGCATFVDSFIANAPPGDPNAAAWVRRMIFWTVCHEMGHCFNLAHSWQKSLGKGWIPLANEPEARSFMNYPFRVSGGQSSFFANFEFRFSDSELMFLRHAPARFVRMGDAQWFDNHGFRQAAVSAQPALRLEIRANRPKPVFDFLEPVVLELKLTNMSAEPQIVDDRVLASMERFTVAVKKRGAPAREFAPFAHYCFQAQPRVLEPGESLYDSLFIAAGTGGWLIDEPGDYVVQAALHQEAEDIVSDPLVLRVRPPRGYTEEELAQDVLTEDVARVLAFDGSRVLDSANAALEELVERLPEHRAAVHARVALAKPLVRPYKVLAVRPERSEYLTAAFMAQGEVQTDKPDPERAKRELEVALSAAPDTSAETLGHVDFNAYTSSFCEWLEKEGEKEKAAEVTEELLITLSARGVTERVLQPIKERATRLGAQVPDPGELQPSGGPKTPAGGRKR